MPAPIVLTTLAHYRDRRIWINCRGACRRAAPMDLAAIAVREGWDAKLDAVRKRLRCSTCGSRDTGISIAHDGHRVTDTQ